MTRPVARHGCHGSWAEDLELGGLELFAVLLLQPDGVFDTTVGDIDGPVKLARRLFGL
jgi:hypothetical protein